MALSDITLKRGDTPSFNISFKNEDGTICDLTGWVIWFTVRKTPADTLETDDNDALISIKKDNLNATGIVNISLTEIQTNIDPGTYLYEIQTKDASGCIQSSDTHKFIVNNDITRDI